MKEQPDVVDGSITKAEDYNDFKNNVLNFIADMGLKFDSTNDNQFIEAIEKLGIAQDYFCIDTATPNTNGFFQLSPASGENINYKGSNYPIIKLIFKANSQPRNGGVISLKGFDYIIYYKLAVDHLPNPAYNLNYFCIVYITLFNGDSYSLPILRNDILGYNPIVPIVANTYNVSPELRIIDYNALKVNLPTNQGSWLGAQILVGTNITADLSFGTPYCISLSTGAFYETKYLYIESDRSNPLRLEYLNNNTNNPMFTGDRTLTNGKRFWQIIITPKINYNPHDPYDSEYKAVLTNYLELE